MPSLVWIVLAVVVIHAGVFWLVADKHYLPKTTRVPPPPPVNFAARAQTTVDPITGGMITEQQFVVSTRLATPPPATPRPSMPPAP